MSSIAVTPVQPCACTTRCAELWQDQECTEGCSHLLHGMLVPACGALLSITLLGSPIRPPPPWARLGYGLPPL